MRIALVAGEASGDLLAAHLIEALKRRLPHAEFFGIGGPKMQRVGFNAWWPAETLAVRGYAEVLKHYRRITGVRRDLLKRLKEEKPDIFIGVDAPDFNLWLEGKLKRSGIPAMHYVSPSIWAWRGGRVRGIARAVDHILALFPFEPPLYEKAGVPVTYVGHPLADVLPLDVSRPHARERLGLAEENSPIFALLPGSRQSELQYMAATFIQTAGLLRQRFPKALILVPLVSRETRNMFETELWAQGAHEWLIKDVPDRSAVDTPISGMEESLIKPEGFIKMLFGHAQDALAACDVALVASGTATLEAALLKTPMVITYQMSPWSWRMMRGMRYQPWVGLPNVLAGGFAVPEFLQDEATPENLSQALGNLVVDHQVRDRLDSLFTHIHRKLRQNTAEKAANAVLALAGSKA